MRPSKKVLLLVALGLLWILPMEAGASDKTKAGHVRTASGHRVRSQPSRPATSAPKTASPRSRGSEPRGGVRSGTWVNPGSRTAQPPRYRPPYYRPPYYRSPYYYPFWGTGYWGSPYYWGGYWGPYWGGYWGGSWGPGMQTVIYRGEEAGALDLDISPEEAEVVVDGNLVGTCDDFDGYPDYLWLKEGSYALDFFLEGYETKSLQIEVVAGVVHRLDFSLDEGESIPPSLEPRNQTPAPRDLRSVETEAAGSADSGREAARIWLYVSPGDASVYLDGRFLGTADEIGRLHTGMVVDSGRHLIQVVRPGYRSQEQAIAVEGGDELDVRLDMTQD